MQSSFSTKQSLPLLWLLIQKKRVCFWISIWNEIIVSQLVLTRCIKHFQHSCILHSSCTTAKIHFTVMYLFPSLISFQILVLLLPVLTSSTIFWLHYIIDDFSCFMSYHNHGTKRGWKSMLLLCSTTTHEDVKHIITRRTIELPNLFSCLCHALLSLKAWLLSYRLQVPSVNILSYWLR